MNKEWKNKKDVICKSKDLDLTRRNGTLRRARYIRKNGDKILVSVSISIPLTDIGVSRTDTLVVFQN